MTGCSIGADAWRNQPLPSETPPSETTVTVGAKKTIQMSAETIDVQAIAVGNTTATFAGGMMKMTGPATQTLDKVDGKILPGGVEYIRIDAALGQPELDLAFTVDSTALPRIRIARIQ